MLIESKNLPSAEKLIEGLRGSPSSACHDFNFSLTEDQVKEKIMEHLANVLMLLLAQGRAQGLSFKEVFDALERKVLDKAISICNGHQANTANFLHLLPTTLCAKLKKHRIVAAYRATAYKKGLRPAEERRGRSFSGEYMERGSDSASDDTHELPLDLKS